MQLAGDKPLCLRLARAAGVVTPPYLVFRLTELARAQAFARTAPGPCVVKPADGTGSAVGITTGVATPREVEDAAVLASLVSDRLLIEHMVPGESYRLLFLDGRLLHAVRRRGTRVVGDGRSSVAQLARALGVSWDPAIPALLGAQHLQPGSVPEPGRSVLVRALPVGQPQLPRLEEPPHDLPGAGARQARQEVDLLGGNRLAEAAAREPDELAAEQLLARVQATATDGVRLGT